VVCWYEAWLASASLVRTRRVNLPASPLSAWCYLPRANLQMRDTMCSFVCGSVSVAREPGLLEHGRQPTGGGGVKKRTWRPIYLLSIGCKTTVPNPWFRKPKVRYVLWYMVPPQASPLSWFVVEDRQPVDQQIGIHARVP